MLYDVAIRDRQPSALGGPVFCPDGRSPRTLRDPVAGARPGIWECPVLPSGECWYLVYTQPHREADVETQLAAQGFRVFLPRFIKTVRHARRLRTVSAPLFPRYLFVGLDVARDRWRSVNGTRGVTTLVMGEGRPTPAPPGIVECLIQACRDGEYFASWGPLEVGDRVRVLNGPFVDMIGEIMRIDAAARVRVLFRMMNGGIGVSVPRSALMRASVG